MNEIVCPVCNNSNPPGSVYCSSCGRQIGLTVGGETDSRRYNIQLSQLRRDIEAIVGRIDRLQGQIDERARQTEQHSADVETTAPTEPETESPETPSQQQLDEDRLVEAPSTEEPVGAAPSDEQQEPVAASVGDSGRESPVNYGQGLPREIPNRHGTLNRRENFGCPGLISRPSTGSACWGATGWRLSERWRWPSG